MEISQVKTEAGVESVRNLIAAKFGYFVTSSRLRTLEELMDNRAMQTGWTTRQEYMEWLHETHNIREFSILVDQLTIKETFFFRNIHQFRYVRDRIFSGMVSDMMSGRSGEIRILSAGCATGEEPASVAMTAHSTFPAHLRGRVRIDAFDVSSRAVARAGDGRYVLSQRSVQAIQDMNKTYLERYFRSDRGEHVLHNDVTSLIQYRVANLKEFFAPAMNLRPKYDLIFCRNVMIYFNREDQGWLVEQLERNLAPGGFLLTGDAEALHLYSHGLQLVQADDCLIYQKPRPAGKVA